MAFDWQNVDRHWDFWAEQWHVELGDEATVSPMATSKDWRFCVPGTTQERGKNHPRLGDWLLCRYRDFSLKDLPNAADPFCGVGGLWLDTAGQIRSLLLVDCEQSLVDMASKNVAARIPWLPTIAWRDDARSLRSLPPGHEQVDLVMTSPPFRQSHMAGMNEKQQRLMQEKRIYNVQGFRCSEGNLGNIFFSKQENYFDAMQLVYERLRTLIRPDGYLFLVLRNFVRNNEEVDEVGAHLVRLRRVGFRPVRVHPRMLRPTFYMQSHISKDPNRPWISTEWSLVLRNEVSIA